MERARIDRPQTTAELQAAIRQGATDELQAILDTLWTQQDLVERFGVTGMTIHLWRQNRNLPTLVIPGNARPAVRFVPDDVKKWAQDNDIQIAA